MQTNLAYSGNPFAGLFDKRSRYDIDLSDKTLVDVLNAFVDYKRKRNPNYTVSSLVYNLNRVQILSGHLLMPDDVTDIFYSTFSKWLTDQGVKYSSQKTYISIIRAALNWGAKHSCPVSSTYEDFSVPKTETNLIALSADDVSHIAHFDVNTINCRKDLRKTLEKVRDFFVLSCNLGQRYSDMVRLTPENFERNIFRITQKKTGNKASMDIDRLSITPALAFKILEKYNYSSPWTGHINNYNNYLHILMRAIGDEFNDELKNEYKINGQMIVEHKKKYEMIASHTARRTFVTYNANRSVPVAEMMRATGHKSMSSFSGYIKFGN